MKRKSTLRTGKVELVVSAVSVTSNPHGYCSYSIDRMMVRVLGSSLLQDVLVVAWLPHACSQLVVGALVIQCKEPVSSL